MPVLSGIGRENTELPNKQPGGQLSISPANLRAVAEELLGVPGLAGIAQQILSNRLLTILPQDQAMVGPRANIEELWLAVRNLTAAGEALVNALRPLLARETDLNFYVRLPEVADLETLEGAIGDVRLIFDHPARRVVGEGVGLVGVDRGSAWLELVAASALVLHFTSHLIELAPDGPARGTRRPSAAALAAPVRR